MQVATSDARLRILLPMVDGLASWHWAADEVEQVALAEGKQRGTDFLLGAMIELPSAVFVADELANCADFFSLGTNDLVQYLLAVDRQNPGLSEHAQVTHPAVLRALKHIIDAGSRHQIPMSCCGEMAASPIGIMILVGMGLRELSVPPLDLGMARTFLRRSEVSIFEGLVQRALTMQCDQEIKVMLNEHYQDWKLDQSR
jgi:phosphoenolpyruvate-protein kinase (PTS system EI component)